VARLAQSLFGLYQRPFEDGPRRLRARTREFRLISWRGYRTGRIMTDESTILAANAAFYAAFSMGDGEAMARLWADDDAISCIHPGWPAIVGRIAVVGSWRDILENARSPAITCHEPHAIITGDEGRVLCIEMIGPLALAASNHFRRVGGMWRLVHHQASPITKAEGHASSDPFPPAGQIH
jgi:hypothetical protein